MNGEAFIRFAGKIAAMQVDAASCRSVVSRAYYGAFHIARDFLSQLAVVAPKNANTHVFVQHQLAESGVEPAMNAASLLADLHTDRIEADYKLQKTNVESSSFARACVERAVQIESALEACREPQTSASIKAGIAEYTRRVQRR
jgi:hypothetical protein